VSPLLKLSFFADDEFQIRQGASVFSFFLKAGQLSMAPFLKHGSAAPKISPPHSFFFFSFYQLEGRF